MIDEGLIRCSCGRHIVQTDIVQAGLYVSVLGPSLVYVRYRCKRCKMVGDELIEGEAWDPSVLHPARSGPNESELARFGEMGDITAEEVIGFHYALERLSADPEEEAR